MQRNKISFKGQKIFIGIDVHKSKWAVTCLTESGFKHTYAQKASVSDLATYQHRNFPDGEYHAVYEAGFTGFFNLLFLTGIRYIKYCHSCCGCAVDPVR